MSTNHFRAIVKRLQVRDKLGGAEGDLGHIEPELVDSSPSSSAYFFTGAQRQHNVETIRHLSVFGDLILLLTGVVGGGKSSLLSRVEKELSEDAHVVMVRPDASQKTDSHGLVKLVAHQSAIFESASESNESLVARIMSSYQSLREQTGKRTLLVVDDADRCSTSDLSLLVSAIEALSADSPVVLLLAAQPAFAELAVGLSEKGRDLFHQVHLKSLTESDLLDYVQGGLSAEGYGGVAQLDESALHRLYERSKGVPKLIDSALASILFGVNAASNETLMPASGRLPTRILASIVVILVLSFLFVGYQHKLFVGLFDGGPEGLALEDSSVSDGSLESDGAREARLALLDQALAQSKKFESELVVNKTIVAELEQEVVASPQELGQASAPELSQGLQSVSVDVIPDTDDKITNDDRSPDGPQGEDRGLMTAEESEAAKSLGSRASSESLSDAELASSGVSSDAVAATPATKIISTASNERGEDVAPESKAQIIIQNDDSVKRISITKPESRHYAYRDQSWLRSQSADYYTMQVLGSHNESTARAFIDRSGQPSLIYVQSEYKGRPWYVVLHGQFESKSQADAAKQSLPSVLAQEKPWIRSFSGM
jgi:septal ring-binding cell division protein DamX/type II secretory pathway predicted ATPase ExeA